MLGSSCGRWQVLSGHNKLNLEIGIWVSLRRFKVDLSKLQRTRTLMQWENYSKRLSQAVKRARIRLQLNMHGCFVLPPLSLLSPSLFWLSHWQVMGDLPVAWIFTMASMVLNFSCEFFMYSSVISSSSGGIYLQLSTSTSDNEANHKCLSRSGFRVCSIVSVVSFCITRHVSHSYWMYCIMKKGIEKHAFDKYGRFEDCLVWEKEKRNREERIVDNFWNYMPLKIQLKLI